MTSAVTKATLTPARKRLIELMQEINHGRIEGMQIRDGDPILDPPPTILWTCKFGGNNEPNVALSNEDFVLKKNVTEMLEIFDREQSFLIDELVVANGLPVRMNVKEKA